MGKNYRNYVFKDGRFVGKFDEMYKESVETPWHQDIIPDTWHGKIGLNLLEAAYQEAEINNVLEIGCGYGYILNWIFQKIGKGVYWNRYF